MLIDAHCHLDDDQFAGDLDAVVARALDAGVAAIITAGADIASSQAAVALADKYEPVYAVVGIHPHHAGSFSDTALKMIRSLAQHRKVVGIGEIGLDFHYEDGAPREVQERNFTAHLDLAQELGKPVVMHDRDAHVDLMRILKNRHGRPGGMLHCFSGNLTMAQQAIRLGYRISFAGNVTFSNARALQAVARGLALDQILLETDSPYLSPRRGRRNEPARVVESADKIAELLNVKRSEVDRMTFTTSEMLFGLPTIK